MVFDNVDKEIELKGKSVINDKYFEKIRDEILNKYFFNIKNF